MKTTSLVPWFGSKRGLAPKIVQTIGAHRCYFEPACGSLAVLLAKPVATMETVNDLHGDLVNLARCIQDPYSGAHLFRRLRRTWCSQILWEESHEALKAPFQPTMDRAYNFFIDSWLGRNGTIGSNGGNNFCVRYTSNGGSPGTRFKSTVDSIPAFQERLRGVIILSEDGIELTERIEDKEGTAIYWDPPYLVKGAKYVHDFKSSYPTAVNPLLIKYGDHAKLAIYLRQFKKTKVVVSYYDHPALAELYPGWQRIDCTTTKAMVSQGRRDGTHDAKAPEILLINQPEGLFT